MSKIILIILLLGGIVFWWHWQNTPGPAQRKKLLQKTIIGALLVISILLVVTGRMHWLGVVFAGILAFLKQGLGLLIRYFPMLTQLYRSWGSQSNSARVSTISTEIIELTLDKNTGQLSGTVLSGEFRNRPLNELNQQQLSRLMEYCHSNDPESGRLLQNYIDKRFGNGGSGQGRTAATVSSEMTEQEALQVLGLTGTPTKEEITGAYRKIMQQLHPDRGGNDYFAAKANEAREILMARFS
ncbi:MAG: molecular chaperone DnaJ [Gammaproteobacteria bacterium]